MITVKEKFATENLFDLMNKKIPFAWSTVFSVDEMKNLFDSLYGEHIVASGFENKPVEEIANDMAGFFCNRWNSIYKFYADDELLNVGYKETITENISDNGTSENSETTNEVNKVSAYNDDDMSNDTSRDNTTGRNGTTTNKRERTYTRQGYHDAFANYRLKYIDRLQKEFIYGIIFKDVKTLLTAPLYNSSL